MQLPLSCAEINTDITNKLSNLICVNNYWRCWWIDRDTIKSVKWRHEANLLNDDVITFLPTYLIFETQLELGNMVLCCRIGYSIPMFSGFVIMFISTISEFSAYYKWKTSELQLDANINIYIYIYILLYLFFFIQFIELNYTTSFKIEMWLTCVLQCLLLVTTMGCCLWLGQCKELDQHVQVFLVIVLYCY